MKLLFKRLFGIQDNRQGRLRNSEFSKFVYNSTNTQKKKIIEKVIREANRDQRDLVQRVERAKMLKVTD